MVIQHNIPALNSHRNLGINNSKTAKNLEKLSSGFKINRAGDDAAGLAISEKMRGQISGLGMAEQNANNAISLIQTAEGGLAETHSILQRMRELGVQSSNGTYVGEDRSQIELEFQSLKSEIDRIASYTNYNGIKLMDGTVGGTELKHAAPIGDKVSTAAALGITTNALFNVTAYTSAGAITTAPERELNATDVGLRSSVTGISAESTGVTNAISAGTLDLTFSTADAGANWTVVASNLTGGSGAITGTTTNTNGVIKVQLGNNADSFVEFDLAAAGFTLPAAAAGISTASSVTIKNLSFAGDAAGAGTTTQVSTTKSSVAVVGKMLAKTAAINTATLDVKAQYDKDEKAWIFSGTMLATAANGAQETFKMLGGSLSARVDQGAGTTRVMHFEGAAGVRQSVTIDTSKLASVTAPDGTTDSLLAGSITFNVTGINATGAQTPAVANAVGYTKTKDMPAQTPDQARAQKMLDGMGLSDMSEFDLTAAGLAMEFANKDAYILTRESTDADERDTYKAGTEYETVLQVGDKTFIGKLDQTLDEWTFYDNTVPNKPVAVGTMSNAQMATESGSIRFNIGDPTKANQERLLFSKEDAIIGAENTASMKFQIGANGAEDQTVGLYVYNMSSNNLGDHSKGNFISEASILDQDLANTAVNTIDKAINYVSSQRAKLGALQNRLEHTLNNLGVTKENLTAAESSIRDVDMAKEMMEFTKNNIASQAAQAMLAQANQLPQGVLQLLR